MAGPYYVYSEADLNIPLALGDTSITSALLAPDVMNISDDDLFLNGLATSQSGILSLDQNQILSSGLVLDGISVGNANDIIFASNWSLDIETAGGQVITLYPIVTMDPVTGDAVQAGLVSTAPLAPSTGYTLTTITPFAPVAYANLAPCFTRDTLIECKNGPKAVQNIREDDAVVTRDHGLQTVRWIGQRRVCGLGEMAPVRFKAGVLGNSEDLRVSPMHRMVVSGSRAELLFGEPEFLVHASHLCDGGQIFREPVAEETYFHLMFDQHEIICAYGCWSESFALSKAGLEAVDDATRAEIILLFPELIEGWVDALPTLAPLEAKIAL